MKKISKSQQTLTRKGYLTQKPRNAQVAVARTLEKGWLGIRIKE